MKPQVKTKEATNIKLATKQELAYDVALLYDKLNQQEKLCKARREKILRPILEEAVEAFGSVDAQGHKHLINDKVEIVLQRRTSPVFNAVAAEKILAKKGLLNTCQKVYTVTEIDENKVYEAYEAGLLTAKDINQMFQEKENFALIVTSNTEANPEIAGLIELRKKIERGDITDMPLVESEDM